MPEQSKAAQRSLLILQFGRLMAPIYEFAERASPPDSAEYRVAVATLAPDIERWTAEVNVFATVGGSWFGQEANDIFRPAHNFRLGPLSDLARNSSDLAAKQATLRQLLKTVQEETLAAIESIPIEWEARLLAAKTPFSVYMHIRDAISTAKKRIHYCDRYLNVDFFHLYVRDLARSVQVRLVTTQGNASFGVTNLRPVSSLVAGEFADCQLIECDHTDLHDRNLRIDDQIFFLGPSINAAGTHPTNFSPTDSSAAAHAILDAMIAKGSVIT